MEEAVALRVTSPVPRLRVSLVPAPNSKGTWEICTYLKHQET